MKNSPLPLEPLRLSDGTVMPESNPQKRQRYAAKLLGSGLDIHTVAKRVARQFHVSKATAWRDVEAIGIRAAREFDSEAAIDAIVHDAVGKVRRHMGRMAALAELKPGDLPSLDPKIAIETTKLAVAAGKEMRQSAETLVEIYGRVQKKWSPKGEADVYLHEGTDEEREAVSRLLGNVTVAPARAKPQITEKELDDVLEGEYEEVTPEPSEQP